MTSLFMTPAQLARAKESLEFWLGKKAPKRQAFSLLGCEGGETGFKWLFDEHGHEFTPPGDHGMARGPFQTWPERGGIIFKNCGKDVRFGTHLEALEGCFEEMTAKWSAYRHVWPALMASETTWADELELVKFYEQSKSQGPDIVKRSGLAVYLEHELGASA